MVSYQNNRADMVELRSRPPAALRLHAASLQAHSACFGPLAIRQFAGLPDFTLVPSRVRLPQQITIEAIKKPA